MSALIKAQQQTILAYKAGIKAMVTASGLAQPAVVKGSGVARETLYRYLHGNETEVPSVPIVAKIAHACGYRVEVQFVPLAAKEAAPAQNPMLIAAIEEHKLAKYQQALDRENMFTSSPGLHYPKIPPLAPRRTKKKSPIRS